MTRFLALAFLALAAQTNAPEPSAPAGSCREEIQRLCPGVRPGGGAIIACLKEHRAELSCAGRGRRSGGRGAPVGDVPAAARTLKDQAYGADPAQKLDVYLPEHPRGLVIVMVHGGGWFRGDKAMANVVANKAAHWLPEGTVFVSVETRLLPTANPVEQAEDVARALAYVQAHAREWGANPADIVLMGHSAGAHVAALVTADPKLAASAGAKPWRGTIALDSAALDAVQLMQAPHFPLYDRAFGKDPAFWRAASPTLVLNRATTPILLVCSSQRRNSCAQAQGFADKDRALGGKAEVLPVDLSHEQINAELGTPGDYTTKIDAFLRTLGLP